MTEVPRQSENGGDKALAIFGGIFLVCCAFTIIGTISALLILISAIFALKHKKSSILEKAWKTSNTILFIFWIIIVVIFIINYDKLSAGIIMMAAVEFFLFRALSNILFVSPISKIINNHKS